MPRRNITALDANRYLELVKERFASWIEAGYDGPKAIENWDGNGHWAICWDGGPYDWSYYGTIISFGYVETEPEFGFRLPKIKVPASLSHVYSEPYDNTVVVLYLED